MRKPEALTLACHNSRRARLACCCATQAVVQNAAACVCACPVWARRGGEETQRARPRKTREE